MSWRDTIVNSDEVKVFEALDQPGYTWRTVSAVAREAGLTEERVSEIFEKYENNLTRRLKSPTLSVPDLVGLVANVEPPPRFTELVSEAGTEADRSFAEIKRQMQQAFDEKFAKLKAELEAKLNSLRVSKNTKKEDEP